MNRAFKSAGTSAGKFGRVMGSMGRVAGTAFIALGAGAAVAGVKLFNLGADLEQMRNKAETVFGDSIGAVEQWADATAHAMGQTTNEAIGVATSIGDILIPMGFAQDEAAAMATEMASLTGALSAWDSQGRDAAEIGQILTAALTGERDALKGLGVVIDEAFIKGELLARGQEDLTGEALKQARAQITLEEITRQSASAISDFAENNDTTARKMDEARAKMRELWEQLALKLAPAFAALATFIVDSVVPAISNLWSWFETNLLPKLTDVGEKVGGWLIDKFQALVDFIRDPVIVWLRNLWQWFGQKVIPKVVELGQKLFGFLTNAFAHIRDFIRDEVIEALKELWEVIDEDVIPTFTQFGEEVRDPATTALKEFWAVIEPVLLHALENLKVALDDAYEAITTFAGGEDEAKIAGYALLVIALIPIIAAVLILGGYLAALIAAWVALSWALRVAAGWFKAISAAVALMWPIWKTVFDAIIGIVQWAIDKVKELRDLILGIPGAIADAIGALGGLVTGAGLPDIGIPGLGKSASAGGSLADVSAGRSHVTINIEGSVLTDRDLENKLRDMNRRGLLTPGGAVRA